MLATNGRQGADNPNTVASAVRNLRCAPERILLAAWGSSEIVRFVRARGLAVDRVVGGHGGVAAWADVERAAQGVP